MESTVINPTRLKQLRDRAAQEKVSVDALLERWLDSTAEQPRVDPLEQQGSLLQQISDAIVVTNRKLEITGWNQAAMDIYGWTEAEAIGQEIHHLLKTAWTTETQAQAQAMLAETGIYRGEIQQQTRGGNPLYIQSSVSWIKDAAGEIIRSVTVNRDVTERKQDEKLQALLSQVLQSVASERSLPYILDQLLQGIEAYQPGMKGSILLLDTDTNRLHHGAAPSLPGSYNAAIDGIEIGPRVGSCGTAAFEQRRVIVEDIQTDPLWVDFRDLAAEHGLRACWSQPIVQQDGTVLGTLALYYTQTKTPTQREIKLIEMAAHIAGIAIQQKQREGELRASEERLRGLSDAPFEAIFLSHKGICLDQNRAAEEMFGYALDEAVGRYGTEWIVPEDRETVMHNMLSGYEEPYQVTALRKDRSTFPVEIRGKMITYKGQPVRVTALHDISERKQVEDALRKSEERFRTVADWTYDWEYWVGPEGEIFYMSPSCERVTGYPASAFVVDPDLLRHTVHLDDRSAWDQHHRLYRTNPAEQKTGQLEYRIVTPDGTIRWIDHLCRPVFSREGDYRGHRVSSRDITERKQASTALRESEARFRHYMENLPGAVFLKDDQDRLIYCNRFYASLVGSAPAALIGRLSSEYTDDIELNRRFMDENRQVLQEGQPGTFIHAYQTPNGESYWQTVKFPVELPNGSRQIGAISLDVTNRKRVEEALRQSEEAYRGVVEDTPMLLCRFLPEGEITFVNQAYCNYHARTSEELVGYNFLEFLPEPDRSFVLANLAALTAESPTQTHEHRVMAPNGEVRWQRWTNRALFDAQGKIIAYQSVGEDVTEQRSMREWLDLQNVALEAAANAIAVTDIEGRIQWVNPAFTTLTGYTLAEARGQKPSILKSGKHDVAFYQSLWDTILSGQVWQGQSTNRRKDGSLYTEEQTITPVRDRHGKISHFISIKQDVTERVQVEQLHLEQERIKVRLKKEQEFNALVQKAVSALSHDVRTPLAVIATAKDMLSQYFDRIDEKKRREKLDSIGKQLYYVLELLDDMTLVVKSGLNHTEYKPIPINLGTLCQVVIDEIQAATGSKHRLVFTTDGNISTVMVDEILVSRILLNLLSNAVKFSPEESEIRLDLSRRADWIVLRIMDQGMGIHADDRQHVFEPFFRAEAARSIGGTGLGLNIVKECVERHQGRISVESEVGKGTTFTIELPLKPE